MKIPAARTIGSSPRSTRLIEQRRGGMALSTFYQLELGRSEGGVIPPAKTKYPEAWLTPGRKLDFVRHRQLLAEQVQLAGEELPVLITERHYFSLPFYDALSEKYAGQVIRIVCLDMHLDGVNPNYANWGFWAYGLKEGIIRGEDLQIIGSSQVEEAERFMFRYPFVGGFPRFAIKDHRTPGKFLDQAAATVAGVSPGWSAGAIRRDHNLRNFAEYAALRNAGVSFSFDRLVGDLAGQKVFLSFDTDVPLLPEAIISLMRQLRQTELVGVHLSELDIGTILHKPEGISHYLEVLLGGE